MNPDKRKALYLLDEELNVKQIRPKLREHCKFRHAWTAKEDALKASLKLANGNKITIYEVEGNELKSRRIVKYSKYPLAFVDKQRALDYLESIKQQFDYTITKSSISVFYGEEEFTMTASDKRFPIVAKACLEGDFGTIMKMADFKAILSESNIDYDNNKTHDGEEIPKGFRDNVTKCLKHDPNSPAVKNFWNRLEKNPEQGVRENLYKFLAYHGMALVEDGRFLAYKYVNSNFYDQHTGSVDWGVGNRVQQERSTVVVNPDVACSSGLHVGAWDYVRGNRTKIIVCVDPKHVVSVPNDYSHQKMRCCEAISVKTTDSIVEDMIVPSSFVPEPVKTVMAPNVAASV
jgi:hypothetical protein